MFTGKIMFEHPTGVCGSQGHPMIGWFAEPAEFITK